jgi:predicted component of type VI protein secretion system
VERDKEEEFALRAYIQAVLVTENVPEPVSFTTVLQTREGSAEVHAGLE